MLGLFAGNLHPPVKEGPRHFLQGKPGDNIERKINCIEFDMRNGMQQGDHAPLTAQGAPWNAVRGNQFRLLRPPRTVGNNKILR